MPASDPLEYDSTHRRPPGATDAEVEAAGKVSEAVEWLERARGCLFDFHQMLGHLDFQMGDAVELLRTAGREDLARFLDEEIVGRNVLDGRWTFQIVEEFDEVYYGPIKAAEQRVRDELMEGKRHVFEAELKEKRRTKGRPDHEARPPAAHHGAIATEAS